MSEDLAPYRPPALVPQAPTTQLDFVRQQIAPKASDLEIMFFAEVCQRLDLDPFKDQIYLIPRNGVHKPQVSVAGRRAIAYRTGEVAGIEGPTWCGPAKPYVWEDVWLEDEPPHAARTFIWRKGMHKPANGTAPWREFAQYKKGDRGPVLTEMWQKYPAHMLGKCSESLAWRRAFPETNPGLLDSIDAAVDDGDLRDVERVAATITPPSELAAPKTLEERIRDFREAVAGLGGDRTDIRSIVEAATYGRTAESSELGEDDLAHLQAHYTIWRLAKAAAAQPANVQEDPPE